MVAVIEEEFSGSKSLDATGLMTCPTLLTREPSSGNWSVNDFIEEHYSCRSHSPVSKASKRADIHRAFLEQQFGAPTSGTLAGTLCSQDTESTSSGIAIHRNSDTKSRPNLVIDPHLAVSSPRPQEGFTPKDPKWRHALYISSTVWPKGAFQLPLDDSDEDPKPDSPHNTKWKEVRKSLKSILRLGDES